ncbi:MAG: hypothetical protein IJS53_01985 [Clostridia bacterium]|nr:hypothetical protein [Clostridia bacterium]
MLLPIGYILMAAGLHHEAAQERRVAATAGLVFAALYAALIFLVYFAQTTSVRRGGLSEQAAMILDFRRGGLIFNYDLLGYGMMALSTFFLGLSMQPESKADRWLKALMMIHGAFFIGCFLLPMTGAFSGMADGETSGGGVIALLFWCAYFLPVGALGIRHFRKAEGMEKKA